MRPVLIDINQLVTPRLETGHKAISLRVRLLDRAADDQHDHRPSSSLALTSQRRRHLGQVLIAVGVAGPRSRSS